MAVQTLLFEDDGAVVIDAPAGAACVLPDHPVRVSGAGVEHPAERTLLCRLEDLATRCIELGESRDDAPRVEQARQQTGSNLEEDDLSRLVEEYRPAQGIKTTPSDEPA